MSNSQEILISVENIAPENGTALSPLWVGIHDGRFDSINLGEAASPGIEQIAEDGIVDAINQEFDQSGFGSTQGVVVGPDIPDIQFGEVGEIFLNVEDPATTGRYLSYAVMVLPSNDTFAANDDPTAFEIFDSRGRFLGADFVITGEQILDAGTEVNDEAPESTAFFGQTVPDAGIDENGVITRSNGFIPGGPILSSEQFSNADFTQPGYQLARVRVFNVINGEDRRERLKGTRSDDYINGNGGSDIILGRGGNDRILGGAGSDFLSGNRGDDELFGEAGDDILRGGAGNDFLDGGAGVNILIGGAGDNTYAISSQGFASINGFDDGDLLSLGSSLHFDDLTISQVRRNTIIEANGEQIALLRRVDATTITESVFV